MIKGMTPYQFKNLNVGSGDKSLPPREKLEETLKNTPESTLKPTIVFTFDDGFGTDYDAYLMFKSYGVYGSSFLVKEYHENGYISDDVNWTHLTMEQINEMKNDGWEFGSHSYRHVSMGVSTLTKNVEIGDTKLYTTRAHRYEANDGLDILLEFQGESEKLKVIGHDSDADGRFVILDKPTTKSWPSGESYTLLSLTDEELYKEVVWNKDYWQGLGLNLRTLVYPYNAHFQKTRKWVKEHFMGARAYGKNEGVFGAKYGATNNYGINLPTPLNQYALYSFDGDGVNRGDPTALSMLDEVAEKKGLAVVMLHSGINAFDLDGVEFMIEEAKARGIEITTLERALHRFGNSFEIGDWCAITEDNYKLQRPEEEYFEVIPAQY